MDALDIVLDKWTIANAIGIFAFLRVLTRTPLAQTALYKRALPILPDVIGVASAFLGGIPAAEGQRVWVRVALGLACGYAAQRAHKILGQTILGDDPTIEAKKARAEMENADPALIAPPLHAEHPTDDVVD